MSHVERAFFRALLLLLLTVSGGCGEEASTAECQRDADCFRAGAPYNPCATRVCSDQKCSVAFVDYVEPPWQPDIPNDCRRYSCVAGDLVFVADDADVPALAAMSCSSAICVDGRIVPVVTPAETPCEETPLSGVCDGAGTCEYRAPQPCHDLCTFFVEGGCATDYLSCGQSCSPSASCLEAQTEYYACWIAQGSCEDDPEVLCSEEYASYEACKHP